MSSDRDKKLLTSGRTLQERDVRPIWIGILPPRLSVALQSSDTYTAFLLEQLQYFAHVLRKKSSIVDHVRRDSLNE